MYVQVRGVGAVAAVDLAASSAVRTPAPGCTSSRNSARPCPRCTRPSTASRRPAAPAPSDRTTGRPGRGRCSSRAATRRSRTALAARPNAIMPSSPPNGGLAGRWSGSFTSYPYRCQTCEMIATWSTPLSFKRPQVLRVALVGPLVMAPNVEHDPRAQHAQVGRFWRRHVRQHFGEVPRNGEIAHLVHRVARAIGFQVVRGVALRARRGMRLRPIEIPAGKHVFDGEVHDPAGQIRDGDASPQRDAANLAQGNMAHHRLVATGGNHHRLARKAESPCNMQRASFECVLPRYGEHIVHECGADEPSAAQGDLLRLVARFHACRGPATCGRPERRAIVKLHGEVVQRAGGGRVAVHNAAVGGFIHEAKPVANRLARICARQQIDGCHATVGTVGERGEAGLFGGAIGRRIPETLHQAGAVLAAPASVILASPK